MMLFKIPDSLLIDVLTIYIELTDYNKFEIANTNKHNQKNLALLNKSNWTVYNITDNKYDKLFNNDNFVNWITSKQINLNKVVINNKNLITLNYIRKLSNNIKIITLNKIYINFENILFPNLETLILNNIIDGVVFDKFTECHKLKSVTIYENYIMDNDTVLFLLKIAHLLESISIKVSNNFSNYIGMDPITNILLLNMTNEFINLTSIQIGNCGNITDETILKIIQKCKIKELFISDGHLITNNILLCLASDEYCMNLEILKLYNCKNITNTVVEKVFIKCKNIKVLGLSILHNITHNILSKIIDNCSNLTQIHIIGTDWYDNFMNSLCDLVSKCQKITHLNFKLPRTKFTNYNFLNQLSNLHNLETLVINNGYTELEPDNEHLEIILNKLIIEIIINSPQIKSINIIIGFNLMLATIELLKLTNNNKIINFKFYLSEYYNDDKCYKTKICNNICSIQSNSCIASFIKSSNLPVYGIEISV